MKKLFLHPVTLLALCLAVVSCSKDDPAVSLSAPGGLQAVVHTDTRSATLSWEAVAGASGYEILVESTSYTASATSVTASGLDYNTDYTWKVRAYKDGVYSNWSATATFRLNGEDPETVPVPTGLQQVPGPNGALLSWESLPVDSYEVDFNGTTHTVAAPQLEVTGLTPETEYTWKVRARKNEVYSNWSATSSFRTTASFGQLITGSWGAGNADINFLIGSEQVPLDMLLTRDHPSGAPVQIVIAENGGQHHMRITGMDTYLSGGETSSTPFDIDGQLVDLSLSLNEPAMSVTTSKAISSQNVYTKYMHIQIRDIPGSEQLLGEYVDLVGSYYIEDLSLRITRVSVTGTFADTHQATYGFVYEVSLSITHNIPSFLLALVGIDDVNTLLPTPQQLLSEVVCTKE
jgi:chitodextrinase